MDGLALGIVEAVHGVDAGEHAESVAADDGEEELERQRVFSFFAPVSSSQLSAYLPTSQSGQ